MTKRKIPIKFQIYNTDDDVMSIDCEPNEPIGSYRKQLIKDSKYKNYVFGNEDMAFIDENTHCNKLKDEFD